MTDHKSQFDQLFIRDDEPDPAALTKSLAKDLAELRRPYVIFESQPDVPRLLILAGATRDFELCREVARFLMEQDEAHRLYQQCTGTSKEDLGPHASTGRSARWILSRAKEVKLPERACARIYPVLEQFERRLTGGDVEVAKGSGGQDAR